MKCLFFMLILLLAAPALAQMEPRDQPLSDPLAERQARDLMAELRCLQCQNQSIGDSNSPQAGTMRNIVRERLAAGESPAEVRDYFIDRYGDWVSFAPPARPDTLALWMAPLVILGVGLLVVLRLFRRKA